MRITKPLLFIISFLYPFVFNYGQNTYANLNEAQMFLTSKLQNVSNPGVTYQQTFNFETGKPGMISVSVISKDAKGKESASYSIDFYLEHIDPRNILQIATTKELKLEIHTERDQKIFKMLKNGKTSYINSIDLYCGDAQMMRDIKDALMYLIDNTPADKIILYNEEDAFIWLETNVKRNYIFNKSTYDLSFTIDRSNKNKMIYGCNVTNEKSEKKEMKYEFYLEDFDANSFIAVASGSILSVTGSTINKNKAIAYFENGVQKSFVNMFNVSVDDSKLAEDIIAVFERIKTNNYDVKQIKNNTNSNTTEKEYWSSQDYSTAAAGSFSSSTLSNYTGKKYSLNLIYNVNKYPSLVLNADKTYLLYYNVPDLTKGPESGAGWYEVNTGVFEIKDGKLSLVSKRCYKLIYSDNGGTRPTGKEKGTTLDCKKNFGSDINVELIADNQSLYYTEYIRLNAVCSDNKCKDCSCVDTLMFAVSGSEVKAGEARQWKGQQLVVIGYKNASVIAETKLRKEPSLKAAVVSYEMEMGYDTEISETLHVDEYVRVIARTKSKSKVGKVEDYWYLVDAGRFPTEAWVHGQYIKMR